jgi:Na+-transporting NADH:ubiquinone oxidoreductase subunit NqrB
LSLSLLLRADEPWLHAVAGAIAISSKFLLRLDGKHVFNPAGFAIVILLLLPAGVWISPGQWGTNLWFAALVGFFAIMVLHAARRSDIAIFFLMSHAAFLVVRAVWLGDPLVIPLHQLQSGSLLIFTFFMISDPRTSPDSPLGRFLFAFAVAGVAHYLAFFVQMRPALYFALIALSPATLVIDRVLPAPRFSWSTPALKTAALKGASR